MDMELKDLLLNLKEGQEFLQKEFAGFKKSQEILTNRISYLVDRVLELEDRILKLENRIFKSENRIFKLESEFITFKGELAIIRASTLNEKEN